MRRTTRYLHRVLMAHYLGRDLAITEIVHHRDENPHNNRIENLALMQQGIHSRHHHTAYGEVYECAGCGRFFCRTNDRARYRRKFHSRRCYHQHGARHGNPPRPAGPKPSGAV